jgi:hypothetical protein
LSWGDAIEGEVHADCVTAVQQQRALHAPKLINVPDGLQAEQQQQEQQAAVEPCLSCSDDGCCDCELHTTTACYSCMHHRKLQPCQPLVRLLLRTAL